MAQKATCLDSATGRFFLRIGHSNRPLGTIPLAAMATRPTETGETGHFS